MLVLLILVQLLRLYHDEEISDTAWNREKGPPGRDTESYEADLLILTGRCTSDSMCPTLKPSVVDIGVHRVLGVRANETAMCK